MSIQKNKVGAVLSQVGVARRLNFSINVVQKRGEIVKGSVKAEDGSFQYESWVKMIMNGRCAGYRRVL